MNLWTTISKNPKLAGLTEEWNFGPTECPSSDVFHTLVPVDKFI